MSTNEAEKKFWSTPELVEGLLPLLDSPSILALAQAHQPIAGLMQGTHNWSRFVRNSCPYPRPKHTLNCKESIAEQKVAEMKPIIGILQMMDSPQFHLMVLLDIICQRFPPVDNFGHCFGPQHVYVTCPIHLVHHVSPLGFVLLELVEAVCVKGSSELELDDTDQVDDPLIAALKSRMMRQGGWLSGQVEVHAFFLKTQKDAEALLSLAQHAEGIGFRKLAICGQIGERGWAALAEALRTLPPLRLWTGEGQDGTGFQALIISSRQMMLDGEREDVRAVWDALPEGSYLLVTGGGQMEFIKDSPEDWVRLELYLENEVDVIAAEDWDWEPEN